MDNAIVEENDRPSIPVQVDPYPLDRSIGDRVTQYDHTRLWKELDAKNPGNGFGREGDYRNTWVWYDRWVERVRAHCEEQGERYR